MPVQVRFETNHTSEQYVTEQAWQLASLDRCPLHPNGNCGFRRHGTYARQEPVGARVPRWYCRKAHKTISMLPDCLAAKLPGSLAEVEKVVADVEQSDTVEAAADELRPDLLMPGRLRWVRRRLGLVYAGLLALRTLLPEVFGNCVPTVCSFRAALDVVPVLPALRAVAAAHLHALPPPLGFGRRCAVSLDEVKRQQHWAGSRAPP